MKNIRPIFVAYYYPPAGGAGLPGSQRSVKFIRYFEMAESLHVLSINPAFYPDTIRLDFDLPLPINEEILIRTGSVDLFDRAMVLRHRVKNRLQGGLGQGSTGKKQTSHTVNQESDIKNRVSLGMKIKDFIHHAYYSPDMMAPWIPGAVKKGVDLVEKNRINIIFATGSPWSSLVAGRKIALKTGIPYIADFRDPWIGNPFFKSKGIFLDKRESKTEWSIVADAALVTVNTDPLRDEFLERYPWLNPEKIITLPNGFDPSDFDGLEDMDRGQPDVIDSEKVIIAHAGFLYGKRDPGPLLSVIEELHKKKPDIASRIVFQQIGDVSLNYDMASRFDFLVKKGNLVLFPQMPYKTCLNMLVRSDVLAVIQPGTRTQVPSKLYDYLCINKPIISITPHDGALGRMIRENRLGFLFDPQDKDAMAVCLTELVEMKKNGLPIIADYPHRDAFDVRHIVRLLENKMADIVNR